MTQSDTPRIDLTGRQFNEWTVQGFAHYDRFRNAVWRCRCSCGTVRNIPIASLRAGKSRSCHGRGRNKHTQRTTAHQERVRAQLRERHAAGLSLCRHDIPHLLRRSAEHIWPGGWKAVCEACGIEATAYRRWDAEREARRHDIKAQLRALHTEGQEFVPAIVRNTNRRLYRRAMALWPGGWENVCMACDIPVPVKPAPKPTKPKAVKPKAVVLVVVRPATVRPAPTARERIAVEAKAQAKKLEPPASLKPKKEPKAVYHDRNTVSRLTVSRLTVSRLPARPKVNYAYFVGKCSQSEIERAKAIGRAPRVGVWR